MMIARGYKLRQAVLLTGCMALFLACLPCSLSAQEQFIRQIGQDYADRDYYNGLAIGVVNADSSGIYTFGRKRPDQEGKPSEDNHFEIGSLTKVFTTAVFQKLINEGTLDPQDKVNAYLPDSVTLSSKGEQPIRLHHLATHTAGLPKVDEGYFYKRSKDIFLVSENPYKSYTTANLYDYLDQVSPFAKPGEQLHYSNTGVALLGHVMTIATHKPYDTLIARATRQMALPHTKLSLTASVKERFLLQGFNRRQRAVPYWDFQVMAPAGALKSTPSDMLRFLRISMGQIQTPMTKPIQQAQQVRGSGDLKQMKNVGVGYGWFQSAKTIEGERITWHNGQTGGFSSFMAFLPDQQCGVIALANTNGSLGRVAFQTLKVLSNN